MRSRFRTSSKQRCRRCSATSIRIEGAGRTDAGVHARGQRAHADVPFAIEPRGFRQGINNLLPHDIRVVNVEPVADDFHCRFAAKLKSYVYRIWNDEIVDVFADQTHAHVPQPLDAVVMRDAAQALAGHHDFAAFTVISPRCQLDGADDHGHRCRSRWKRDRDLRHGRRLSPLHGPPHRRLADRDRPRQTRPDAMGAGRAKGAMDGAGERLDVARSA